MCQGTLVSSAYFMHVSKCGELWDAVSRWPQSIMGKSLLEARPVHIKLLRALYKLLRHIQKVKLGLLQSFDIVQPLK